MPLTDVYRRQGGAYPKRSYLLRIRALARNNASRGDAGAKGVVPRKSDVPGHSHAISVAKETWFAISTASRNGLWSLEGKYTHTHTHTRGKDIQFNLPLQYRYIDSLHAKLAALQDKASRSASPAPVPEQLVSPKPSKHRSNTS